MVNEDEDDIFNAVVDRVLEKEARKTWKKNFPKMVTRPDP